MKRITALLAIFFPLVLMAQHNTRLIVYNVLKKPATCNDPQHWNSFGPQIDYIGYPKDSVYIGIGSKVNDALKQHEITPEFKTKNDYILYHLKGKVAIEVHPDNIYKMVSPSRPDNATQPCIIHCYPVIIKNIDHLPVDIAIRKIRPISLEMQDDNGTWKTIVPAFQHDCITGDAQYFIRPGEIIILSIPVMPNIHNNLRFKLNDYYSNVFRQP